MERVVHNFEKYLYQLKKTFENSEIKEEEKKYTLIKYKEVLKAYKEEEWVELKKYYQENIHDFPTNISYAIIFLIIINRVKNPEILREDIEPIKYIVRFLIEEKINPINLETYLNIFLDPEIFHDLSLLYCLTDIESFKFFLTYYLSKNNLEKKSFQKFICSLIQEDYSPILKRTYKYKISHMKAILKDNMTKLGGFSEEEYQIVEELALLETELSKEEQEILKKEIQKIEEKYEERKEYAIHLIIKQIKKSKTRQGNIIVLQRNQENKF